MNNLSIITHPTVRVLSVVRWGRPPAPVIVIAAAKNQTSTIVDLPADPDLYVYYPGEGFEGVDLPSCFEGRVKRLKQVSNWQVVIDWTVNLIGVDTAAAIDPQNPQVARTATRLASGTQTTTWQRVAYGPTELVPPLYYPFGQGPGLIPDCGSYVDLYSHSSDRVVAVAGQLPAINPDLFRFEAERVRDKFAWGDFNVDYGQDNQGVFPLVRAVPLTRETLTNFVYPHDCAHSYTGDCRMDETYLWVPPSPGEEVNDREWRVEVKQWQESVDWWGVVAQQSKIPRDQLAKDGSITLKTEASPDDKPTWQITVKWSSHTGRPDLTYVYANHAKSRLVNVEPLPDGGFKETRQLWRFSWHPETDEFKTFLVMTGDRTVSTTPVSPPNWKVEAYEQAPVAP